MSFEPCDLKFYKNGRSTDRASQDFVKWYRICYIYAWHCIGVILHMLKFLNAISKKIRYFLSAFLSLPRVD